MPSLMDLPPETRIDIFERVIPQEVIVELTRKPWDSPVLDTTLPPNPQLALLLTNSVIQAEALLIPEPALVARFTNWHNCVVWMKQTPPSYRAKFSSLKLSEHRRLATDKLEEQQRRVDSANNDPGVGIVEGSYIKQVMRGFEVVELVYSELWRVITTETTSWGKQGAYMLEQRCWDVSGAKDFEPKQKRTHPRAPANVEALLQIFMQ